MLNLSYNLECGCVRVIQKGGVLLLEAKPREVGVKSFQEERVVCLDHGGINWVEPFYSSFACSNQIRRTICLMQP